MADSYDYSYSDQDSGDCRGRRKNYDNATIKMKRSTKKELKLMKKAGLDISRPTHDIKQKTKPSRAREARTYGLELEEPQKRSDIPMKERVLACMVLHALGDTIGYKNGDWEFNYEKGFHVGQSTERLYEFIELGGINHMSIKGWNISDDTIMQLQIAKALLDSGVTKKLKRALKDPDNIYNEDVYPLYEAMVKYFIEARDDMLNTGNRAPGNTLMKNIKALKEGRKWNETPYNTNEGGSGAAMRTPIIGIALAKYPSYLLHDISISSSRITHNSAVGFLGGLTAALFTSFAITGQYPIAEWPNVLMKVLDDNIGQLVKISAFSHGDYERDKDVFIEKWKVYIDDKFVDGKPVKRRSSRNLPWREKYYRDNFSFNKKTDFIGSGGDDAVIISYDCLLDAGNNWEKLVVYSMLHMGDTDTTGCISAAWYGALYGFANVPDHFIKEIERLDEIKDLANKIYEIYLK